jgi:hypothetical protein
MQGTDEFIAWEVSRQSYRFFEPDGSLTLRMPDYPFKYNPIHDLESLWWIAIWTLTVNSPSGSPRNKDQNMWHHMIFQNKTDRDSLLRDYATFVNFVTILPLSFQEVGTRLAPLRSSLVISYQTAERSYETLNDQPFADSELPKTFIERLAEAVQTCPDVKLDSSQTSPVSMVPQNKRNASPPTSRSRKRQRATSTRDESGELGHDIS